MHHGGVDYVLISDAARWYVVIIALWLIAVLLRITYTRMRDRARLASGAQDRLRAAVSRQHSPHPFSTLGLAVLMFVAIIRRFESMGEPGDGFLWTVCAGVTLVLLGVLVNVKFTFQPPWKRHH